MKSAALLLCLSMGFSSAQDTIVLKNGRKADCKIIDFTPDSVKITYRATPAGQQQTAHGLYALSSGGWFGQGIGASTQKWGDLPEAHTDYIFAVEVTAVLLTVAVVGAVVLARRAGSPIDLAEFPDGPMSEVMRERRSAAAADDGTSEDDTADGDDAVVVEVEEVEQ